jgi:hypothetical protein
MFKPITDAWLTYDYVGANYYHPQNTAPLIGGIQGGYSLRKRDAMIDCITNAHITDIQKYRVCYGKHPNAYHNGMLFVEDVFFTHACEMLKKKVPPQEMRSKFSIEAEFDIDAIAHHGTQHEYFTVDQMNAIVQKSKRTCGLFADAQIG